MGCEKTGLVVLLLLALEGLLATRPTRVRSGPGGEEAHQKTLTTDYFCDFDDAERPFCDWSQPADSQGSQWLPAQGQEPGGSPGPPEGDIERRGNYIHPEAGGFAQLESPAVDPGGAEICVRFLYYLYSFNGQLSIEIRNASGSVAPLWTRQGQYSSSWLSGAVTVPAQTPRPFKVVFKGKVASPPGGITLALDSIFIQLGACSPCITKCNFDDPTDLCGWSNPEEGDVAWTSLSGASGPGVGPSDDFSRPGFGSYMLLDSFDEISRGSGFLKSPPFRSGGCLLLTFVYTLHGVSDDTVLKVYAAPPEGDLGVPLLTFKGEHGPNWKKASTNHIGKGDIQFVFEGIYAGKPGLAVDNVAVSPCEDIFASCDFNNNMDPFCGWSESVNNTWKRTNQTTPTEDTGPPGDYPHGEGYYIYVESGGLKPNESTRFSSSPFCIAQEACVEFYYHMHSIVEVETQLRVLLEEPSGSAVLLWNRSGTQSPNWLYGSVTLPYTRAQPSQVTFEVIRGRNAYLDVSLDNILVHKGHCAAPPATTVPPRTISTAGGPVVTVPPDQSTISGPTVITSSGPTTSSAATATKSTGTTRPSRPSSPSPTTSKSSTTQGTLTTTAVPPTTTSIATRPNTTIPTGTTTTLTTTSTATHPNTTVPTGTTTTPTTRPNTTVPTGTTTTPTTHPNTTVPTGTTTTPTTHPNITVPTGTTTTPNTRPNTTVPTGTTTTPNTTITVTRPNTTIPTGTTTTATTTSTATHPNTTVPTGTTTTPTTTSTATHPNTTIPTGTTTTPITISTSTHPNTTIPTGTTTTPITRPNTTIPTGTTTTPTTHPNTTVPTGTTTTPTTHPNITVPTGTTTTPNTGPNTTVPTGTTTTPNTTITVTRPNTTIPTGTTTTATTTSTATHPNTTVPTGTTTTAITTSTATHPNTTVPTGTTTTAITTSTATHPNTTIPTGTTTTAITTSTATHPNTTVPTGTTTTPTTRPNTTVYTGTITTPITHPNTTITTGTTTTPTTRPNTTIPTGTTTTPNTHPNTTVPTGTTTTPTTTITVTHPNTTVPTGTTTTPTTRPNTTVYTGTTTTPITRPNTTITTRTTNTPTTRPNTTVPTGTTTTPTTTITATRPNTTIPTGTTTTPTTTSTVVTGTTSTLKPTTTLQSPTCVNRTSKPPSPSSTLTSSAQSSGPTTTKPLLTGSVDTPKSTSRRPDVDQTTPGLPPDSASCVVSGDPHYSTYDGRLFHFMGNCTYLLTAACNATPDQPAFQVQTTNEHRGSNTQVSYLKSVNVTVHGTQIVLLKGRRVTVDGKRVTLPVSVAGGRVSVRLSGTFVRLQADFGLLVRFDGNHHAEVSVPPSYFGKLCGLCGNFNGQAADDNLKPDGTSAGADVNQLGKSWQVPNTGDPSCTDSKDPEKCDPDIAEEVQGSTSCGILTDPQGPFAPCHGKVPPEGAFENCFYDLCETGGDAGILCSALQSYADRCAQAGVTIVWRNSTFCPLNCPPGSSYSPCGPACPATCSDPEPQDGCPDQPCVEGCVCAEGSVLSGEQCVPLSQCGCTDADGHYHVVGDSWMGNENCTQRCSCAAGNQITCEEWSCTPAQECRPVEGLLGCQDTGMSTCHVAGDPHYYTFDGKMISFMGTCTYTLVALCQHDPRLPLFNITAKNEERGQPEASYLRHVTVHIQGVTITLQKSRRVLIDGQRVRVPVEDRIPGVSIVPRGIYVVIETDFGLMVKFDGNHHLEIQLPGTYFGKVCGMCGNFNNQSADDYLMPNGHLAVNDSHFGNSWKSPGDSDASCQPDNRPDLNPSCSGQEQERLRALCLEIMAPKYQACHALVDPTLFFQNCLYDMCQYQGMPSVLCDNIQAYVEACKSHGVTSISWRNSTFCPLPCPPNSHFTECASPCPASCSNLQAPASCHHPVPCVEGCACDRGYVLSDLTCIPMRECGCRDPELGYHNSGDSWVTSGCRQRCTCLSGQIQCQPFGCQTGSQCATSNEGLHYCRPTNFHQCVILGDPHYRTFDNFVHHFQGRCTYTLTRTLGRLPEGLEPLSVDGRNHRRSALHRVSFLREVYVEVLGVRVTLMQGLKMAVNGVMVTPPYSPTEGLQITQRSRRLILQTDFGFSVSYDGHNSAEIVLPSTYQQRVGGLCGNYDGRRNNEYMKPDGTLARTLNAFGNSWQVSVKRKELDGGSGNLGPARVRRQEPEEEPESGFEMDCTPEQLALVNGTTACGALSDPAGPFSACHAVVSPAPFQESCVFDLCALFNDTKELLCQDLEAYAQLCREQKVDLGPWRQKTNCAMECPAHTSYQPCMTACPASCANLAAQSNCEAPCVEGCASAPGYVLSGLVSVPYDQCGCSINGRYYQINETFMTEDCSQRCTCQANDVLDCSPAGCSPGEICAVSDYVRSCFQDNACLSSPCQNEGTCQVTPGGFQCLCLEGYVGRYCEDSPLESSTPAPPKTSAASTRATSTSAASATSASATSASQALPDGSQTTSAGDPEGPDLLTILLGVFIPLAVILLLAMIILCVCRHRNQGSKVRLEEDRVSIISTSDFTRL